MPLVFRRIIGYLAIIGEGLMGTHGIGEHQGMLVLFVCEKIINTFLLHEPADKVEIRLPVLDAIIPGSVLYAAQGILDVGEAMISEHFLDDVGNGLILKDAAIRGAGEKP